MGTTYVVNRAQVRTQFKDLTSMVKQHTMSQIVVKVCRICTYDNHHNDVYPTLYEVEGGNSTEFPQAYVANIYHNNRPYNHQQQQYNHDLSSNKYISGWRNHPNLSWGRNLAQQQDYISYQYGARTPYQPPYLCQQQLPPSPVVAPRKSGSSLKKQ